jgi:hypothetical protein
LGLSFASGTCDIAVDKERILITVKTYPTAKLNLPFERLAKLNFDQISNLAVQSERLRAVRDLLLARLMSGEIAV